MVGDRIQSGSLIINPKVGLSCPVGDRLHPIVIESFNVLHSLLYLTGKVNVLVGMVRSVLVDEVKLPGGGMATESSLLLSVRG